MGKASRIMYSIANIFNWILLFLSLAGIVVSILIMAHVINADALAEVPLLGAGSLTYFIIVFLVCLVTIFLVRKAKAKGTSKGWDILFIVLGVLDWNVFYILGGIFGLVARD